jgi:hypothetical protein
VYREFKAVFASEEQREFLCHEGHSESAKKWASSNAPRDRPKLHWSDTTTQLRRIGRTVLSQLCSRCQRTITGPTADQGFR